MYLQYIMFVLNIYMLILYDKYMSGNTVEIPSGLVAYRLFLLFSRLLISNNINLSPSNNNYDYEITSKCSTASVS